MLRADPNSKPTPIAPLTYPRPVSPLHYSPLEPKPEELLWEQESSEEEDGDDENAADLRRTAKRRRIEKLGEQYLRGEGVFIMTAAIRGPLGKDWRNPWRRRNEGGVHGEREKKCVRDVDGEAVQKAPKRREGLLENVKRSGGSAEKMEKRLEREISDAKASGRGDTAESVKNKLGRSLDKLKNRETLLLPAAHLLAKGSKNGKRASSGWDSQDWLKKSRNTVAPDCDIYAEEVQNLQRSPSVRRTGPYREERHPSAPKQVELSATRLAESDSFDGRAETMIKRLKRPRSPIASREGAQHKYLARPAQTSTNEPRAPTMTKLPHILESTDPAGAEANVSKIISPPSLKTEEQSLASQPPKPSLDQPVQSQQGRRISHVSAIKQEGPEPVPQKQFDARQATESRQSQIGQLERQNPPPSLPPPTLSSEATSATIVSILPSAQVAPAAPSVLRNESMPSTADKLPERQHEHVYQAIEGNSRLSTQAAIAVANLQVKEDPTATEAALENSLSRARFNGDLTDTKPTTNSKNEITTFSALNEPGHITVPSEHKLLEATAPAEANMSTKQTTFVHAPRQGRSPPTTVTAVKKGSKTKEQKAGQAAVCDRLGVGSGTGGGGGGSSSSQGSIKASLKVCKEPQHSHDDDHLARKSNKSEFVGFNDPLDAATSKPDVYNQSRSVISGSESLRNSQRHTNSAYNGVYDDKSRSLHSTEGGSRHPKASSSLPTSHPSSTMTSNLQDAQQQHQHPHMDTGMGMITTNRVNKANNKILTYSKKNRTKKKNHQAPARRSPGSKPTATSQSQLECTIREESVNGGNDENSGGGGGGGREDTGDDHFDLADAMDSVGSFLQSWDVLLDG